ncbi:MAG: lipoyl synthase, partial [Candidatus Bathyarchaeum sp.]
DDLKDGGAGHFSDVIRAIRSSSSSVKIEVLIPDFRGDENSLQTVIDAGPDVINHNIETVPRLYPSVRPEAGYAQSLEVLTRVSKSEKSILSKSGIMLGLGETEEEVREVIQDLRRSGCDILTVGQYLPPSSSHAPLVEYITPEQFKIYEEFAKSIGFMGVASGPLVRSSYNAGHVYEDTAAPAKHPE